MLVRRFLAVAFSAMLSSPAISSAGLCPESCIQHADNNGVWSTPQCSTEPIYNCPDPFYCTGWNLQTGVWEFYYSAGFQGLAQRIVLRDDFMLTGPASAIPVPVTLRVHLGGILDRCGAHSGVSGDVTLRAGSVFHQWHYTNGFCQALVIDETLELSFTQLPNQPFRVETEVLGGVFAASIQFDGTTEFVLPDGYSLESCQGFQSTPIGVEVATWAQVKRRFE